MGFSDAFAQTLNALTARRESGARTELYGQQVAQQAQGLALQREEFDFNKSRALPLDMLIKQLEQGNAERQYQLDEYDRQRKEQEMMDAEFGGSMKMALMRKYLPDLFGDAGQGDGGATAGGAAASPALPTLTPDQIHAMAFNGRFDDKVGAALQGVAGTRLPPGLFPQPDAADTNAMYGALDSEARRRATAAAYQRHFSPVAAATGVPPAPQLGGLVGMVLAAKTGSTWDAAKEIGSLGADVGSMLGRGAIAPFVGYDYAGLPGTGSAIADAFSSAVDAAGAIRPWNPGADLGAYVRRRLMDQRDPEEQAAIDEQIARALQGRKARGAQPQRIADILDEIRAMTARGGPSLGFTEAARRR